MARKIEVDLTADTKNFERGMKSAGSAVDKFEGDLKSADQAASRFDGALDTTTGKLDSTTKGMRGTADLASGLGDVLGIQAAGPITAYAMGFADIADGLGTLLAPALTKAKTAFMAMNATLLANPIFLVIAALTALTVAFVIAYKKSETFRKIVHGALDGVKRAAEFYINYLTNVLSKSAAVIGKLADVITTPYQIAFRAIARLWNDTLGGFGVDIPGFMGFGGMSFKIPEIPELAKGGIVNRPTLAMIGEAGPEAVVPLSGRGAGGMGGPQRIEIVLSGDRELVELMRRSIRTRGGNVQVVLGSS